MIVCFRYLHIRYLINRHVVTLLKYEAGGVEALRDNRGKQKNHDEMSELEKLRAEVKILRAEKQRAEMEASFLKKLEEIERRRG